MSDDEKLWEAVTKTVTPLKERPAAKPLPKRKRFYKTERLDEIPAEWQQSSAPPSDRLDKNTTKQIRRGRIQIDRTIDLHDHTQDSAHRLLTSAVIRGVKEGAKCLLVITGKGLSNRGAWATGESGNKRREDFALGSGTLKRMVPMWLSSPELSSMVHSYDWAQNEHGGDGALYVMLRKKPGTNKR